MVIATIERSNVRNAIDYQVMDELEHILDEINADHRCKAFMITGRGEQAFCSGGDLSSFSDLHTEEEAYGMLSKMGNILYKLLTLKRPTFALLNGIAIGGGMELASACDFRIARPNTRIGFIQGRLAITTGWGGGTILLEKLPFHIASELLYSATIQSAEWGKEKGYINHILGESNWFNEGINWIEQVIATSNASVLSAYKEMAVRKWEAGSLKERMSKEIQQCAKLWASKEHHEAVQKFLSKER
nr:enoyl-CoA hydratase/isomerase family protein [Bacillus pinisoli]